MCWKEKIQWQSVANGLRKEHVLRPPFLDKVLHHFFFLMVICNSLLLNGYSNSIKAVKRQRNLELTAKWSSKNEAAGHTRQSENPGSRLKCPNMLHLH